MASLIKQNDWYYLQFYNAKSKPNRKRVPLKTRTKRKAEKIRRRLEDAYAEDTYDPWIASDWKTPESNHKSLREALEEFLEIKSNEDWRRITEENNKYILRNFCRFCGENIPVEQLSASDINSYLNREKYAYETKKSHRTRILGFAKWLVRNKYSQQGFRKVKIFNRQHEQAERIHYLSHQDIEKLIITIRDKVAFDMKKGYQNKCRNSLWLIDLIN